MVALLAFGSTAVATLFCEAMLVRYTRRRRPHEGAWAVALGTFALASAALAVGASTGWDGPTFRAFYLLGAIVNVPWLAVGTICLLAPRAAGPARTLVLLFTGLATGALLAAPLNAGAISADAIPEGRDVLGALPRTLAAVGSGVGAVVVFAGALWSAWHYLRPGPAPRHGRLVAANLLIAAGVLVLSAGGTLEGVLGGGDEAFAATLLAGITVIYAGFGLATRPNATPGRRALSMKRAS